MKRRTFLRTALAAPLAQGLAWPTLAQADGSVQAAFARGLAEHPWLVAYADASREHYDADVQVSGRWPKALSGTLYRNGPARHEIGNFRYGHWFDGDGLVHAYRMSDGRVRHRARFVQTYKYQAEKAAGRALYPGFASVPPNPEPVTSPDTLNPANISMLNHHGKLMALWEAGSPWELDPDTLETRGTYAFTDEMRGVPFSAHPRVEADGNLWNFGYLSAANLLVLWHVGPDGTLKKAGKIEVDPITMVHDFVVTERHIVIMVSPLHYARTRTDATDFLSAHEWAPDDPTRVLVISKDDFDDHFWVELPAQWVFHYGNGWEDEAGVIRFDAARADSPLVMIDTFRDIMRGELTGAPTSHHHQYRIDTKARTISEAPIFGPFIDSEFPCVDPRVSCRRNDRLTMLTRKANDPAAHLNLNAVSTFDYRSGKRNDYRYPDSQLPEEHLFVPNPDRPPEQGGWVVGTALDWQAGKHLLNVFDAQAVDAGPIATATLPYLMPAGLHGKFVHA